MRCEKCGQETDFVVCSQCGRRVTNLGPFCYYCGHRLGIGSEEAPEGAPDARAGGEGSDQVDFSSRTLCIDGSCIGVINEQGICKVCGKPYVPES
jgi:hypothetical protein